MSKLPYCGTMFVQDKFTSDLIKSCSKRLHIAMAHTRAATVGKVDMNNAHPFLVQGYDEKGENITREFVGCHNGTLTVSGTNKFGTDSEWALNQIFDLGDKAFKKFNGAFAFTWWDSDEPDFLNIALNDKRDVHVVMLKNGGMLYASEAGMLYWLAERNKLEMDGAVLKLSPGYHYKFDVTCPDKFTKEELPKYEYSSTYTGHTTNYSSTTYYGSSKTHMEQLEAIFEKTRKESSPLLPALPAPTGATKEEKELAEDFLLLGKRAKFLPIEYDKENDEFLGVVSFPSKADQDAFGDLDAVIPAYGKTQTLNTEDLWSVRVTGVRDLHNNNVAIVCGKPVIALTHEKKARVLN